MTHIPGHVETSGGGAESYIGTELFGLDGQPLGTLQEGQISLNERGLVLNGPGGIVPFQGGSFLTAFNQGINLDRQGNLVGTPRSLPLGDSGGSAPAFSSTLAGAEFDANQQRIQRDWESAERQRQEAAARGDTATQNQWQERQTQLQHEWETQYQDRTFAQARIEWDWQVSENKRQEAVAAGNLEDARQWEQHMADLNRQWDAQFQERGFEFTAEQNRLSEEATLKRQRLSTLTDLIQSFVGAQSQARDTLANLQPDPFRFAAVAGGIAPFGTTPQQGFQQGLQEFASQPVPQFDPSGSAASLEPVIAQLTGAQPPQAPQTFGLAGGGTVPFGSTPQVRRVGETGPETMVVDSRGVTILPFDIGPGHPGFQTGGAINFPFSPIGFDASTLMPALGTSGIFGGLGINKIPTTTRQRVGVPDIVRDTLTGNVFQIENGQHRFLSPEAWAASGLNMSDIRDLSHEEVLGLAPTRGQDMPLSQTPFGQGEIFGTGFSGTSTFNKLGIRPSLVRDTLTDNVFLIENGQHRLLTPEAFAAAGFNRSDVVNLSHEDVLAMAPQRGLNAPGTPPQIPTGQATPFTPFTAPIIEPTTGTVLPAPFKVADQLNKLRLTDPFTFNLLLSAYEAAGVPGVAVLGTIQQALPFGQARGTIGLN